MKNSNDTIGNRNRDLPACRAIPQQNALRRAPESCKENSKYKEKLSTYFTNATFILPARTRQNIPSWIFTNRLSFKQVNTAWPICHHGRNFSYMLSKCSNEKLWSNRFKVLVFLIVIFFRLQIHFNIKLLPLSISSISGIDKKNHVM
jgi:hypothetical protein